MFPDLLIAAIDQFKPHKILFHNGLHPSYQDVLDRVKRRFPKIPIVFSELGWFPQKGNIYFDTNGTNGASSIAAESYEKFCSQSYPEHFNKNILNGNVLIVTQLENDTNIMINSPRFKKMENFISHVLSNIPINVDVIIKTHPLDSDRSRFDKFVDHRVSLQHDGNIDEMLSAAKAIFTINSTVALTALNYPCNIYCFGFGLLNNKRVSVECFRDEFYESFWSEHEIYPMSAKLTVLDELKSRQINIEKLLEYPISELLRSKSFRPLVDSVCKYPNSLERAKIVEKYFNNNNNSFAVLNKDVEKKQFTDINVNRRKRLFKKMRYKPYDFFNDSKLALIRPLRFFFRRPIIN
jgi:hypothetical protein